MASIAKGNIITSPQTITGNWADVGNEIEVEGYSFFTANISLDINDSLNVQFRFRAIEESGGTEYIVPLKTKQSDKVLIKDLYYEVDNDIDQNIKLETEIDQTFNIIKLQVKALTVGATAGILTAATYRQGYRQ